MELNTSPVALAHLSAFLTKVYPNLPAKSPQNQITLELLNELSFVNTLVRNKPDPVKNCTACISNTLSILHSIYIKHGTR
jgi:hypothetical protein